MKIRITYFVLATLCTLSTPANAPNHTSDSTDSTQTKESSTEGSPGRGSEERKETEKQEERKLRKKFETEERKYYDKRIANLEKNIQNMLANLYLSSSKKIELDVALALLRKAASSKDIDVKEFAYKEASDISVRALP